MDVLPFKLPPAPTVKLPGLDVVRAAAAMGVVALHACVPYLRNPMPGLTWAVVDQPSDVVDFAFWSLELIVMPLFLVIAGFLAYQTLARHGETSLIKNRARRLLWPLAFAILVVLPADLYVWVLGWVSDSVVPWVKLKSLKFDGKVDRDLWGLSHLWFLQYLFLYVVCLAGWTKARQWMAGREQSDKPVHRSPLPTLNLAIVWMLIGSIVVAMRPQVVWGFQHDFLPVLSKWIYHGLFFAAGVSIAIRDPNMTGVQSLARRWAIPSVLVGLAAVRLAQWSLSSEKNVLADATLAVLTCCSAIAITLVVIGLATSRVKRVPVPIQYLAAASFWVYLVHHPILGLVHIDLKWWLPGAGGLVKAVIAMTVSTAVSIGTYEAFIRKTRLGRFLGMAWSVPETELESAPIEVEADIEAQTPAAGRRDAVRRAA